MVAFYNAKDRAIYDAGDKFVPQTKYLQNDYVPTEGISYAGDGSPVSYANSGIMTQYPIIYPPIINQGGGDGPVDPGPKDYGYKSSFAQDDKVQGPQTKEEIEGFLNDIEEGTIDDEDEKNNKPGTLSTIGKIGSFLANPFGTIGYATYQNFAQKKENEKRRQEAQELQDQLAIADKEIAARGYKEYGTGAASQGDMDSYGVDKDTGNPGNYDQDHDLKDGGRAGYFFGGRVNYKVGGRIGFKGGGGQIGGTADMSGGNIPGPGDTGGEGGDNPSDDSDTQFGGGNDNKQTSNPKTSIMDKIRYNPIINNPFTKLAGRIGLYTVNPTLLGLDYRTASQLKGVYDKATDDLDDEDVTMNKFANGGLASIL